MDPTNPNKTASPELLSIGWVSRGREWECGCVPGTALEKKRMIAHLQMSTYCGKGAQPTLVNSVSCPDGNASFPLLFTIRVDVPELCPERGVHT